MRRYVSSLLACLSACAVDSSDSPASRYSSESYSVEHPADWVPTLVRGLARFSRTDGEMSRHTIVVRAIDRPAELIEGKPTTKNDVVDATHKVLSALPSAAVSTGVEVRDAQLPGTRFSLTFKPPGLSAFHREHVVLVGRKHLYHLIYTAPAREPIDEPALSRIVKTLKEDV